MISGLAPRTLGTSAALAQGFTFLLGQVAHLSVSAVLVSPTVYLEAADIGISLQTLPADTLWVVVVDLAVGILTTGGCEAWVSTLLRYACFVHGAIGISLAFICNIATMNTL